jgi:2-keto-4-pentenoate hydratase
LSLAYDTGFLYRAKRDSEGFAKVNVQAADPATIAGRFLAARREAGGLDGYPGDFPETLEAAYGVQDAAMAAWDRPVVGWKVGRINPPLAERFGADRLAGPIFLAEKGGPEPEMPVFAAGFAAGEAEFLLRLGKAPPAGQARFTLDEAGDLIDAVHVGIEVASSPLKAINVIGPIAVVSDFGNNNGLVIGPEVPDWRSSGFEEWPVTTRIDGREVGSGRASAFPDGAIGAARFLFELMAARGIALTPGQWISSGAVSGVHDAAPGQRVEADFGGRFTIACRLKAARPEA